MLKVAHLLRAYLGQTVTFVWQYISQLERVKPVVICEEVMNLDQFPLKNGLIKPLSKGWLTSFPVKYRHHKLPSLYLLAKAKNILRDQNISVMHAHFGHNGADYVDISKSLNIPLITTFYGHDLSKFSSIELYKDSYKRLFEYGNLFLVEGPSMKKKLVALGCPENKISIQRIAIDISRYKFISSQWNKQRHIKLLFIGRFVDKKGLEYALRAVARLRTEYKFEFRIVGFGPLEKDLKLLCHKLNLDDHVVWLGRKSYSEMLGELHHADVLIQPSVTAPDGESEGGAPTVLLEAQACGVPIISTYHADIPYVTVPDKSAFLVPEKDTVALAEKLKFLFDNPDIWAEMGRIGRLHIEEKHSIKKEVKTLEDRYFNIIKHVSGK
jgi:colanic acid/amylovoran biosynthesis glycosyltransferase